MQTQQMNIPAAPARKPQTRPTPGQRGLVHSILLTTMLLVGGAACGGESASEAGDQTNANATDQTQQSAPAIVFLGDSLTAGRGLAKSEAAPALIEQKIQAAGLDYTVINAGRSGDTTAGGLARLAWYLRAEVQPKVLVIGLGSNDAMRGLGLDEIETNLKEIVTRSRAFDPEMRIFLFQMYTFPNMGPQYAQNYEALFGKVAREAQIGLLPFPLLGVAGESELNQPDGIHPTAEGTVIVADNIWKALGPELK